MVKKTAIKKGLNLIFPLKLWYAGKTDKYFVTNKNNLTCGLKEGGMHGQKIFLNSSGNIGILI